MLSISTPHVLPTQDTTPSARRAILSILSCTFDGDRIDTDQPSIFPRAASYPAEQLSWTSAARHLQLQLQNIRQPDLHRNQLLLRARRYLRRLLGLYKSSGRVGHRLRSHDSPSASASVLLPFSPRWVAMLSRAMVRLSGRVHHRAVVRIDSISAAAMGNAPADCSFESRLSAESNRCSTVGAHPVTQQTTNRVSGGRVSPTLVDVECCPTKVIHQQRIRASFQ